MSHDRAWQIPLLILSLAVALFLGFQVQQALTERANLQQAQAAQDKPLEQAREIQQKLDQLAVGTLRLAEAGNSNAKELVERMKQAGVTITPKPEETPAKSAP